MKRGFKVSTKYVDSGQPAHFSQTEYGPILFDVGEFSVFQKTILPHDSVGCVSRIDFMYLYFIITKYLSLYTEIPLCTQNYGNSSTTGPPVSG